MSKSTRHFFSVEDICAEVDPETLKFYLLSTHYRSPVEFNRERLAEAEAGLERLRNAMRNAALATREIDPANVISGEGELSQSVEEVSKRFVEAMEDDFNSAKALGHLFDLARAVNKQIEAGILSAGERVAIQAAGEKLKELGKVLGLFWRDEPAREELPEELSSLVRKRDAARRNKEWGKADEIRSKIEAMGFVVEDRPEGPVVRRKSS